MIKQLDSENFNDIISKGIVLVDFSATWCGPCKMLEPVLENIASENHPFDIIKIDVDKHENLAREYGIMSVPTMIVFSDGKPIKSFSGFMPKEEVLNQMKEI